MSGTSSSRPRASPRLTAARSRSITSRSRVERGEIFGLLGPNGAGKTTTILMLLGLTDISGGEVRVLGFNPAREPLSVKRRVGYLPDTVGFYDQLTAADNLRYTARLIGFKAAEREKRIAAALDRVGLCGGRRQSASAPSRAACASGSGSPRS